MSRYRRAYVEGGVFFFTITLADRSSDILVRHIRPAGTREPRAQLHRPCARRPYDPEASELLLGTDAVDGVVKATAARVGQIAAATENSVAEPAPANGRDERGLVFFNPRKEYGKATSKDGPATLCRRMSRSVAQPIAR